MATKRVRNSSKAKAVGKDDLYHDIEQEKKKKLDDSGIRGVAHESRD